ncbi:MAG: DUF2062 domain-containing protein [Polyangiaceae bacterium]
MKPDALMPGGEQGHASADGAPEDGGRRFSFVREELRRVWADVRGGDISAAGIAASVALGAFIGSQPLYGLHLPLCLLLCLRFRLDGALAYLAANISNPFMAPFIVAAEVQIGAYVIEGHLPRLGTELTFKSALSSFPAYLAVGSPIFGLGAAIGLGAFAWVVTSVKRRFWGVHKRARYHLPKSAPAWVVAVERVAERYAPTDDSSPAAKAQFNYVRIKLLMDPIAKLISSIMGEGKNVLGEVFDIGTGRGQLPILLVELGRASKAAGVDWDEKKVEDGARAAKLSPALPVELVQGDARTAPYREADTVLLIDLVHYFKIEEQDAILERAAKAVRPGGRLLLREADTERGIRSFITLFEEKVFTLVKFNRGERVKFRSARELAAVLEGHGLKVRIEPAWGKTPFSNVLLIAERPASAPAD